MSFCLLKRVHPGSDFGDPFLKAHAPRWYRSWTSSLCNSLYPLVAPLSQSQTNRSCVHANSGWRIYQTFSSWWLHPTWDSIVCGQHWIALCAWRIPFSWPWVMCSKIGLDFKPPVIRSNIAQWDWFIAALTASIETSLLIPILWLL